MRRSLLREVPFDPHLEHLFNGEEILFSARAWTHGVCAPAQQLWCKCFCIYLQYLVVDVMSSFLLQHPGEVVPQTHA